MASLNLTTLFLLSLVLLLPAASLGQVLGVNIDVDLSVGDIGVRAAAKPALKPDANANVSVMCGNTIIANGTTNAQGRSSLTVQVQPGIIALLQGGQCAVAAQLRLS